MTLGIIGPELSCEKTQKDMEIIAPTVKILLYKKETSAEALSVIERCEQECDAVLFTGSGPCAAVTQQHKISIPYEFLPKDSSSLTKAFWDVQHAGYSLDYFSLDVPAQHVVDDVLYEMNLVPDHMYCFPFDTYDEQSYIDWHIGLWNSHKTKVILTGFAHIYNFLKKQNYPVFYLPTTRAVVRETFTRLMGRMALKEAHYSQIAVEILEVSGSSDSSEDYYSNRLKYGQVENHITCYCQELQASFFNQGPSRFIIFSNKGNTRTPKNYQLLENLQLQIARIGFHLNAGIGISATAYQSESNAKKALTHSLKSDDNHIYMVDENNQLSGPLGSDESMAYSLASSDELIVQVAEKASLSPASVSRLYAIIQARGSSVFDVAQLADALHISVRSAHRLVKKLLDADCATICAKEGYAGGGRPKSLFEIHLK